VPAGTNTEIPCPLRQVTRSDVMWQAWINDGNEPGCAGIDGVSIDRSKPGDGKDHNLLDALRRRGKRPEQYRPNRPTTVNIPKSASLGKPGRSAYPLSGPGAHECGEAGSSNRYSRRLQPHQLRFDRKRSTHDALEVIRQTGELGDALGAGRHIKSCFDENRPGRTHGPDRAPGL